MAELTDDEVLALYNAGNEVAQRGGRSSECPHPVGSYERERWMLGFEDGGGDE